MSGKKSTSVTARIIAGVLALLLIGGAIATGLLVYLL
jgi:hypothetical protein